MIATPQSRIAIACGIFLIQSPITTMQPLKFVNLTNITGEKSFGFYSESLESFIPTWIGRKRFFLSWNHFETTSGLDSEFLENLKKLCPQWVFESESKIYADRIPTNYFINHHSYVSCDDIEPIKKDVISIVQSKLKIDIPESSWRVKGDSEDSYCRIPYIVLDNGTYIVFDCYACDDIFDEFIGYYQIFICIYPPEHKRHNDPGWEYHPCNKFYKVGFGYYSEGSVDMSNMTEAENQAYLLGRKLIEQK